MNELISRVFATRNLVHLEHWRTKSFSQHMALGDLYNALIEDVDSIVEAYQGAFGLVKPELELAKEKDILSRLEADMVYISDNRKKITKGLPAIDNLLQGLEHSYLIAIYKLKNLS